MALLLLHRKDPITGSHIVVEEGSFVRPSDAVLCDQRLLCETHGDTWEYITHSGSVLYVPKSERLKLIRRPWHWCGGCAVAYGEQRPPNNWFYESVK